MATYNYLDMFLGFSLFAITTCAVPALIHHWKDLFDFISHHHCWYRLENFKQGRLRLLGLISLTIATWFLAAVTYARDISAAWSLMQASRLDDGHRGFAFGLIQAYFIVLVICGVLALGFTGRFLYQYRHEFRNLVRIIRYRAAENNADVDLENGKNDQWEMDSVHPNEDDPAGSDYGDTTTEDEYEPHDDDDYISDGEHDWSSNCCGNKRHDDEDWPAYVEILDKEGKGDNEPVEDDSAGSGYDDTDSEDDSGRWCPFCKGYMLHITHASCFRGKYSWSNPCESKGENQDNCPESNNGSDVPHLTPPSSGSDAEVNTATPGPPTFNNWYAPPDDTESCSSCDSEYTKTIPWTRPAAHREPLTPTSPTGYAAGVEDNDDGEESDVSDGATIGEPEGGDTETWNNGDSSISCGSAPGQGFQSEQEDIGPANHAQESNSQTTSAQEQRPQPTGTAFSPPNLPARYANILADERGHAQGPPAGTFRHGIARPLRLTIPTQGITNAEPGAPTTPSNSHSLAQWPGTAYAGNSWRDV